MGIEGGEEEKWKNSQSLLISSGGTECVAMRVQAYQENFALLETLQAWVMLCNGQGSIKVVVVDHGSQTVHFFSSYCYCCLFVS